MQRFVHKGVGIAFIDVPPHQGDGPVVLAIHGFASNHSVNWVGPQWVRSLTHAGYRVIAMDNRGHGQSDKLYDAAAYDTRLMADDAAGLLEHLDVRTAGVIGYSMGARIAAFLAVLRPDLVASLALGGLGIHLIDGVGLPQSIAAAMEAERLEDVADPMGRMFRAFAMSTKSDLKALAACIRGSRQVLTPRETGQILAPTIICVGTNDPIAGDPHALARHIPGAKAFDIEGRDHNLAVGDRTHREAVIKHFNETLK
ncbi:MAG TPA: alpha/beta hydrolase [Beijerinckiaceae bacterium]|nr:alpha/beta hydrolase [Beijerinckiaceae bacterium]